MNEKHLMILGTAVILAISGVGVGGAQANVVPDSAAREDFRVQSALAGAASSVIDEIVQGAQRMPAAALRAEVAASTAPSSPLNATRTGFGWWCAMPITSPAR